MSARLKCTEANVLALTLTLLMALLGLGCSTIDLKHPREPSTALVDPGSTRLGQMAAKIATDHPGQSGFRLLNNGVEAFSARLALIDAAQQTLDVQYYIIHGDDSGKVLIDRLLGAADRGVRVRILVDDIYLTGADANISVLDLHPNVEIRLFNPWKYRGGGFAHVFGFLSDAKRLNHRMHNKLFAADNVAMVMGGRNLGDEYFGLHKGFDFADLDVLAVGPVTAESSRNFDLYWNSQWAVPIQARHDLHPTPEQLARLRTELTAHNDAIKNSPFGDAAQNSEFTQEVREGRLHLIYAPAKVLADDPGKVVSDRKKDRSGFLLAQLHRAVPRTEHQLLACSPYFVPGKAGVKLFESMTTNGVEVRIVTNALEANDVSVVHSGYSAYRADLLRAGVHLYELKRVSEQSTKNYNSRYFGSANASLHAKCMVADSQQVFIGSLNLDPRSIERNTETGLVIDSPELGQDLARILDRAMAPAVAYEVILKHGRTNCSSKLEWITTEDGKTIRFTTEPGTTWFQRFKVKLMRLLPIESQI